MMIFFFALAMCLVATYGLALSDVTRKSLAVWLDKFNKVKEEMSEVTIQEIGDTLLNSYFLYKRNQIYYVAFAWGSILVNTFVTTMLAYDQPNWLVIIVAATNFFVFKFVVAMHRDNDKQKKRIQAIVKKYPQSFVDTSD